MSVATKPRTIKHIATPASAFEIQEAVGVTEDDRAIVRKVLGELGLDKPRRKAQIHPLRPRNRTAATPKKLTK